jgi:hypothetical protein
VYGSVIAGMCAAVKNSAHYKLMAGLVSALYYCGYFADAILLLSSRCWRTFIKLFEDVYRDLTGGIKAASPYVSYAFWNTVEFLDFGSSKSRRSLYRSKKLQSGKETTGLSWDKILKIHSWLPRSSKGWHRHPNGGGWVRDTATVIRFGPGLLGSLGIAFVVLKLCHVINWSWWLVTLPFWGLFALVVAVPVLVALATLALAVLAAIGVFTVTTLSAALQGKGKKR